MARKNYTDEFRRQAVDLYRSTPGATLRGIAAELGISRHTLNDWVRAQSADARTAGGPGATARRGRSAGPARAATSSAEQELVVLRARVAALQTQNEALLAEQTKLETERDILRQAG